MQVKLFTQIFSSRFESKLFGGENNFLQLFTGKLESYVDNSWGSKIPLSQDVLYRLEIQEHTSLDFNGEISDFSNFIISPNEESNFTLS